MNLAEIKARTEAATPGPWTPSRGATPDGQYLATSKADKAEFLNLSLNDDKSELWLLDSGDAIPAVTGDGPNSEANAEFIAHAREDIPKLVGVIEDIQAELLNRAKTLQATSDRLHRQVMERDPQRDHESARQYAAYAAEADAAYGSVRRIVAGQVKP